MKVYNTLTRSIEEFKPIEEKKVKMFVCGPTVYDYPHLGHGRAYSFYDTLAKWLRYNEYQVFYLQNITDIDDKIIKRAKEKGKSWDEIARKYEKIYYKNMRELNIGSVSLYARATYHIKEIISQIERLLKKGLAYITKDGVYYDVSKFDEYGKLSKQKIEELKKHRIEPSPYKRNVADFSLWKFRKGDEPYWESPFGLGRPGWHIEDTAISEKYFGFQYDIHGGGEDLIFPHHEAEIAQMEGLSGKKPFVKYWIHISFLKINGEKMSKSLGNFITIQEVINKYKNGEILRLYYNQTHYRRPLDFRIENLEGMKEVLNNFYYTIDLANSYIKENFENSRESIKEEVDKVVKQFEEAMNNNLNTPVALAKLHDLRKLIEDYIIKEKINLSNLVYAKEKLVELANILGFLYKERSIEIENLIKELINLRNFLRERKEYEIADKIRDALEKANIEVVDLKGKTIWRIKF